LAKKRPPGGDRRYRAGSRQQRGAALFRHAGNQKIELLHQLEAIARLSVQAHEHRTARGVEDSVDVANAQAELLAAQQQVITAQGTLTQYRETLRALIGADAHSMPEIHPVALPTLQETPRLALV
jgi:multidrug efflux system outer membrane protein